MTPKGTRSWRTQLRRIGGLVTLAAVASIISSEGIPAGAKDDSGPRVPEAFLSTDTADSQSIPPIDKEEPIYELLVQKYGPILKVRSIGSAGDSTAYALLMETQACVVLHSDATYPLASCAPANEAASQGLAISFSPVRTPESLIVVTLLPSGATNAEISGTTLNIQEGASIAQVDVGSLSDDLSVKVTTPSGVITMLSK